MRRLIAAASLAAVAAFSPAPADADACVGTLLCGVSGCTGTVNVCPTGGSCSGGVSVCPSTPAEDCHSSVDICNLRFTVSPCSVLGVCAPAPVR